MLPIILCTEAALIILLIRKKHAILMFLLLSYLAFSSGCSEPRPPVRQDSYMFWNSAASAIQIFSGSTIFTVESSSYRRPELWTLDDEGWKKIDGGVPTEECRMAAAYDPLRNQLHIISVKDGNHWVCGDGHIEKTDTMTWMENSELIYWNDLDGTVEAYYPMKRPYNKAIYVQQEGLDSYWIKNISVHLDAYPRWRTVIHDEAQERLLSLSLFGEPDPLSYVMACTDEGWYNICTLTNKYSSVYLCWDGNSALLVDRSNDEKGSFLLCRIHGDGSLEECLSVDAPEWRDAPAFAYDPMKDMIIMYGGARNGIFGPVTLEETWTIQWDERENAYIWEKIG